MRIDTFCLSWIFNKKNNNIWWWLECLPMVRETRIQSQVESYQRLKKWYLMPPCLTLSIIRYGSRVKWSNQGKGVGPFPIPWCCSFCKGSLQVTLDYSHQLYLKLLFTQSYIQIRDNFVIFKCFCKFIQKLNNETKL